jgi:hypothetical protein
MITGFGSLTPDSYTNLVTSGTGRNKIYVPVSPGLVIYSQFEHVSGIATSGNQKGVTITKVSILNTLIDRLIDMKQKPDIPADSTALTDDQVDALIKNYQTQIKDSLNLAQANPYALGGGAAPQTGALFNIAA